jgi:hypothetical protein
MELEVRFRGQSLTVPIDNPFRLDMHAAAQRIEAFIQEQGSSATGRDINGLLAEMIRGVAGCEDGCPADAQQLVARGFPGFQVNYIEGGILHAESLTKDGSTLIIKMFPDF